MSPRSPTFEFLVACWTVLNNELEHITCHPRQLFLLDTLCLLPDSFSPGSFPPQLAFHPQAPLQFHHWLPRLLQILLLPLIAIFMVSQSPSLLLHYILCLTIAVITDCLFPKPVPSHTVAVILSKTSVCRLLIPAFTSLTLTDSKCPQYFSRLIPTSSPTHTLCMYQLTLHTPCNSPPLGSGKCCLSFRLSSNPCLQKSTKCHLSFLGVLYLE